jgi:transcriptional regulator with XRE-family HTH domain
LAVVRPQSNEDAPAEELRDEIAAVNRPQDAVGTRIRAWRRRCGLTLDELAVATGVSKSYLSRLESGAKAPSIATVVKLSRALGISVGALFGERAEEGDIHVVRVSDREKLARGTEVGATFFPLSPVVANPGLESFFYYPSAEFSVANHAEHAGDELIYVLSGQVEVRFADRDIKLSEEDYLQFPGHFSHQLRRTSKHCVVLIVISRGS